MAWEDVQEPQSMAPRIGNLVLPNDWHQALLDASERHGIDPNFAQAVMAVESNYKPSATSKKGAMGLMQLMPDTARQMGVQDPYNPIQNIEGGIKLLGQLSRKYNGDLQKVAHVYNAGSLNSYNPETRAYIPAVMAAYRQASGQQSPVASSGQWIDVEEAPQPQPPTTSPVMSQEGIVTQEPNTLMPQPNITPDQLTQRPGLPSPPNVFTPPGQITGIGVEDIKKLLIPDWATAGAGVGGMAGKYLGGPLGGAIGGGLGFAGTQMIENLGKAYQGEQLPPITDQLGQYGKGFLAGAAGQGVGEIIPKVLSPFSGGVAKRMAENPAVAEAQALVEKGARISPSEISGSRIARGLETIADSVWPASSKMAKSRNSLQAVAEGLKNEFVASRGLYNTSKKGVDAAWESWVNLAGGPEANYPMPNTVAAIEDAMQKPFAKIGKPFWKRDAPTFLYEAKGFSPEMPQEAQEMMKNLQGEALDSFKKQMGITSEPGQVNVQSIRNLMNTLSPSAGRGAERTAMMKIADAVYQDLGAAGGQEVTNALQNARELTFQNRTVGPLRAIFNQSITQPKSASDVVQFNPSSFVDNWNKKRYTFLDNKNYSEADIAAIDKFANQMRAMIPDIKKGAEAASKPLLTMPQSAGEVARMTVGSPIGVGVAVYNQPLLALPVGADWGLAKSLMNPNGIMRKFLTTGLKPPTLPAKIGLTRYLESKFLGDQNE